jgi:NADH-quinone oxidoreductase subunit F
MAYPYRDDRETTTILSRHMGEPEARSLSGWLERGGYEALRKAVQMEPDKITDVVKESGLRGRGGAGFPTGMKWSFMPSEPSGPHYLCANADESEPGAFKDREIMRWTPHLLIEGCLIAARAIRASSRSSGSSTRPSSRPTKPATSARAWQAAAGAATSPCTSEREPTSPVRRPG